MHNAQTRAVTLLEAVKKRSQQPVLKIFGEYLEGLRGDVSRERISMKLAALGVPLGGSTLAQYEKGAVWAPDPGVLWGLARIYQIPIDDLIYRLRSNRMITLNYDAAVDVMLNDASEDTQHLYVFQTKGGEKTDGLTKVQQTPASTSHSGASLHETTTEQPVRADAAIHGKSRIVSSELEDTLQAMREATAALRLATDYAHTLTATAVGHPSRQAAKARAALARKRQRTRKNRRKGSGAA